MVAFSFVLYGCCGYYVLEHLVWFLKHSSLEKHYNLVVSKKVMRLSTLKIFVFNMIQVILKNTFIASVCYVTPNMCAKLSVCHLFNRSTRIQQC